MEKPSTMPQKEIVLDERMTDETKNFVRNFRKPERNSGEINLDELKSIRKMHLAKNQEQNKLFKFESLEIKEFFVKSKFDDHQIAVTSYKPIDAKSNTPIVVYFHGGGWTFGCREGSHISVGRLASNSKTIWLSVEYRLCPEVKFPVPLNDCFSVFEWIAENKSEFSSSGDAKLGVCGDSAGGNIAALVSNEYPHLIDYQILIYPCLDFSKVHNSEKEFVDECYVTTPNIRNFFRKTLFDDDESVANSPKLSPLIAQDFSKLPRTIIIASELDPLVDHSRAYYEKLQMNSIPSELSIIKGVVHGFFNNPIQMKNAFNELDQLIVQFLKQ